MTADVVFTRPTFCLSVFSVSADCTLISISLGQLVTFSSHWTNSRQKHSRGWQTYSAWWFDGVQREGLTEGVWDNCGVRKQRRCGARLSRLLLSLFLFSLGYPVRAMVPSTFPARPHSPEMPSSTHPAVCLPNPVKSWDLKSDITLIYLQIGHYKPGLDTIIKIIITIVFVNSVLLNCGERNVSCL